MSSFQRTAARDVTGGDIAAALSGIKNDLNLYRGWRIARLRFGYQAEGPDGVGKIGANTLDGLKARIDEEICGWAAHDYHMEEEAIEEGHRPLEGAL